VLIEFGKCVKNDSTTNWSLCFRFLISAPVRNRSASNATGVENQEQIIPGQIILGLFPAVKSYRKGLVECQMIMPVSSRTQPLTYC